MKKIERVEFTLEGEKHCLNTKKYVLTDGQREKWKKIEQIIAQCQAIDFVADPCLTGGEVINDPYGQPYQFPRCSFG